MQNIIFHVQQKDEVNEVSEIEFYLQIYVHLAS